jgi:predicted enzyme related to lactoylglutathione lyase
VTSDPPQHKEYERYGPTGFVASDEFAPQHRSTVQTVVQEEAAMSTTISEVGTVAVPVTDVERALEFYVGTLGFEKRMDATFGEGLRWVELAPPGATTTVALAPSTDEVPAGRDTGIRLTSADADADHAALRSGAADVDDEVMRWPGVPPMFGVRDPEGNRLYVVERRD